MDPSVYYGSRGNMKKGNQNKSPTAFTRQDNSMEEKKEHQEVYLETQEKLEKNNILKCGHCHRFGHTKSSCRYLKRKLKENEKNLQKDLQEKLLEKFTVELKNTFALIMQNSWKPLLEQVQTEMSKILCSLHQVMDKNKLKKRTRLMMLLWTNHQNH